MGNIRYTRKSIPNRSSLFADTSFGNLRKVGILFALIGGVAILLTTIACNDNSVALALSDLQKQKPVSSSIQQSTNSIDSNSGGQSTFQSNTNDAVASSSSGDTSNLTGDINSMVGNLGKNLNKIIQNSVQNSVQKSATGSVSASTDINKTFTGKIASAQLNLKNGNLERVLYGDWSLDAKTGKDAKFSAKFVARSTADNANSPSATTIAAGKLVPPNSYTLSNLKISSIQRTNDDVMLRGTVDVTRQSGTAPNQSSSSQSWAGVPTTISIMNHNTVIIISLDKASPAGQIFQNIPIVGVITASS